MKISDYFHDLCTVGRYVFAETADMALGATMHLVECKHPKYVERKIVLRSGRTYTHYRLVID